MKWIIITIVFTQTEAIYVCMYSFKILVTSDQNKPKHILMTSGLIWIIDKCYYYKNNFILVNWEKIYRLLSLVQYLLQAELWNILFLIKELTKNDLAMVHQRIIFMLQEIRRFTHYVWEYKP